MRSACSLNFELIEAIKRAAQGDFYFNREVAQSIALSHLDIRLDPLANLSTRAFDIFRMWAEGRSYAEIAQTLPSPRRKPSESWGPVRHRKTVMDSSFPLE